VTTASPQTSIDENPTVVFNSSNGDTVNVKLKVTNSNGCSDSIVKPVIIRDKFSVFLPNAFTLMNYKMYVVVNYSDMARDHAFSHFLFFL